MMFPELSHLLARAPSSGTYSDYAAAVVATNALEKSTLATRQKSLRHLRELYALRGDVPLFAGLRGLWSTEAASRPLIAVVCAASRDPLLRSTADVILKAAVGQELSAKEFSDAVDRSFPGRFSPGVLARIGRNIASSWTQSGHLRGRVKKTRVRAAPTSASLAYALYVSHLAGETGTALFQALWTQLNDAPEAELRDLAQRASRQGWITYRSVAGMTEVTFEQMDALVGITGHHPTT